MVLFNVTTCCSDINLQMMQSIKVISESTFVRAFFRLPNLLQEIINSNKTHYFYFLINVQINFNSLVMIMFLIFLQ